MSVAICVYSLPHLFLFLSGGMVSLWLTWAYCTVFSYYTHILTRAHSLSISPHAFHSYTPVTSWPWKQHELNALNSMYATMLDWTYSTLSENSRSVFTLFLDWFTQLKTTWKKGSSSSQWITLTEQTSAAINWLAAIPSILMSLFSLVSFKCSAVEMTVLNVMKGNKVHILIIHPGSH